MTFYDLDEWFWTMFELTPTWSNFTLGQHFMWRGVNNDHICLPMVYMSRSEQWSNRLRLGLILSLVRFSCELGQIINQCSLWLHLGSHNYTLSVILICMSNMLSNLMRTIWVKIQIWRKKSILFWLMLGSYRPLHQILGYRGHQQCQQMQTSSRWQQLSSHLYSTETTKISKQ